MQAIVLDPRGENVLARQAAASAMLDHRREARRRDSPEQRETGGAPLAKSRQRSRSVVVEISSLRRPALWIDRREALAAVQNHAEAGAEVFDLLVTQVTHDLDGRPLGRRRACPPGSPVETIQQGVEHERKSRQLGSGAGQDVLEFVHVLTPPSSALYSPRSIRQRTLT
jgi:hypothetical protein